MKYNNASESLPLHVYVLLSEHMNEKSVSDRVSMATVAFKCCFGFIGRSHRLRASAGRTDARKDWSSCASKVTFAAGVHDVADLVAGGEIGRKRLSGPSGRRKLYRGSSNEATRPMLGRR